MSGVGDLIKKKCHRFCSAVVVAAGDSARMGEDKLEMSICGKNVLALSLACLDRCSCIDEIVVVTRADKLDRVAALCRENMISKVTKIVIGGKTRTESALAGVSETDRRARIICIHDGARPFTSRDVVEDAVQKAQAYKAAAPAVAVKDTLKSASGGVVTDTPDRSSLFAVQTPQAFDADLIKAALTAAVAQDMTYTDDCSAVEALGMMIHLSRGSEENIKITTPMDIDLAELIYKKHGGIPV